MFFHISFWFFLLRAYAMNKVRDIIKSPVCHHGGNVRHQNGNDTDLALTDSQRIDRGESPSAVAIYFVEVGIAWDDPRLFVRKIHTKFFSQSESLNLRIP